MISDFIRQHGRRLLHHYLWPARLHSRFFNFDYYYQKPVDYIRVNLGAGPYFKKDGWIATDFLPEFKSRPQGTIVHLDLAKNLDELPFDNIGALYMSHTLEHFRLEDSIRLLSSVFRGMRSGGVLRIVVPDADLIIDKVRENDIEYFAPYFSYFKMIDKSLLSNVDVMFLFLCEPRCRYQPNSPSEKTDLDSFGSKKDFLQKSNNEIIESLNDHDYKNNQSGSLHLSCYNADMLCQILSNIGFKKAYRSAFMQSNYGPMREVPLFDGTHPWLSLYVEAIK